MESLKETHRVLKKKTTTHSFVQNSFHDNMDKNKKTILVDNENENTIFKDLYFIIFNKKVSRTVSGSELVSLRDKYLSPSFP